MLLSLILASFFDVAGDDGMRARQSMGKEELLMVKAACLGDILEEAGVETNASIPGEDQSAHMRHLNEELMRLA